MDFIQQFRAALRVSTPIVAVRTFDARSTVKTVTLDCLSKESRTRFPMIQWDTIEAYRPVNDKGAETIAGLQGEDGADILRQLPEALKRAERIKKEECIIFVANAHLFWNEPDVIQGIWNLRDGYKADGNMLVLLCAPGAVLPAELVNDVLMLDQPLPTVDGLKKIISNSYKSAKCDEPKADTVNQAVDALLGLPAFPADQATAMCLDNTSGTLDIKELWGRKREIIAQTPGCSVYEGSETLKDVRGLESVVNFLRKRMTGKNPPKALLFMDEVEKAFAGTGTDTSGTMTQLTGTFCSWFDAEKVEGVQFLGLPGVSKSALAKALANEFEKPLIIYDLAGMQNALVGRSGDNLRAAQKMVNAISDGRLLVISTCNGIESLPPEIRRRLGSLGVFFFDAPTADEREAIWKLYREKYNIAATDATPVIKGEWTGAEIKECCRKADIFGMSLAEAAKYIVPVTQSASERIKALRLSASGKFLSASYPGVYEYNRPEVPSKPVASEGRLYRMEEN